MGGNSSLLVIMAAGTADLLRRLGRLPARLFGRKTRQFRRWLEHTSHLEHLSVLVFAPLLIGVVTMLSNSLEQLSFLLFPPLASGTYTLFADPEGRYSEPTTFVGGMTIGAFMGWLALEATALFIYDFPAGSVEVHAGGAALGLFLTGLVTWILDLEEPTAFSTALLVLITGTSQLAYVVSVALSSTFVAVVFVVWRSTLYERRARYLYSTTQADDRVLVPMTTVHAPEAAMLGARIAAAHDTGKVVLLDVVDEETIAEAERAVLAEADTEIRERPEYITGAKSPAEERAADWAARTLERQAAEIQSTLDVPCDVVVAVDEEDTAGTIVDAAERTDCDLVVAPFEYEEDDVPPVVADLFATRLDVIAFRPDRDESDWNDVLVTLAKPGNVANAMMDYAERLAGAQGRVTACTCIEEESKRRAAEHMLADVVEVSPARCETRVARSTFEEFLEGEGSRYDVVFLGASTDRSAPSRLLRSPAYRAAADVDTDVAIVHLG